MDPARTLPWDWHPGSIPANVEFDPTAYIESTCSFLLYRSELPVGVNIGYGASVYQGTMFDVGRRGQVLLGDYAMLNGARIICDQRIQIGDHALISWNVVLMDTYRMPLDPQRRRALLENLSAADPRLIEPSVAARPIIIEPNVWIGFDACILPGVTIGRGAVVGARSVVTADVPPMTVVAGNPARVVREL